jgi:diguanylate cyclase (GGDEF)-like protein
MKPLVSMQLFREKDISTGLRVLVVDDDPAMLRLLSHWLQKAGYTVETASDGEQALRMVQERCPDFLLTDWEMPRMNGLELCRQVRQLQLPHYVYVLFLTVKSTKDEVVAGLEIGADEFLSKPVQRAELLARMYAGLRVLELERSLNRMAQIDPLTNLMNRRTFFQNIERMWQNAQREGTPLACVMIDIDFFKRINDLHGHGAGDALLKSVSKILGDACTGEEIVCRYGGEEFCAILPNTWEHDAMVWADRVRCCLASTHVMFNQAQLRATGSFGVAQTYGDTRSCDRLLDHADQALLCAKQSGRNRVVRYSSLAEAGELRVEDKNDLFRGITAGDVMTPVVACLRGNDKIGQAAEFFLRSRLNSTPVVDLYGHLLGILSEKDLLAALTSLDCWNRPVRDVMQSNVICYSKDTPIRTIYEFLCRVSIRRVVIADGRSPLGTISRATLLRWFRNLVVSRGLLQTDPKEPSFGESGRELAQQRLVETTSVLASQIAGLHERLQGESEDLVPYVVGTTTRMQELLDDLLAFSHYANPRLIDSSSIDSILFSDSVLE